MNSGAGDRARRLFDLLVETEPDRRCAFLEEQCAGDAGLRAELEALLAADAAASGFLEVRSAGSVPLATGEAAPASDGAGKIAQAPRLTDSPPAVPLEIAGYKIVRTIAEGGMGVVYEAEQPHPRRRVALKVLRAGLTSGSAMRRFQHEAEILGRLRHSNIAKVFEAGTYCPSAGLGLPFFAMEHIPNARTLTRYASDEHLSIRQRLAMVASVCDAVHHGHQRGIIHRDLKPGNILVDEQGEPKVIDFGVARSTDADITIATFRTDVGELVGTLPYMSPEQCRGDSTQIDARCDVYALGVVLYELLTGQLPYLISAKSPFEIPRVICEMEPRRPCGIRRDLPGDVETIILRALQKDPQRRYQSALELKNDLRRFLDGHPIEAKRDRTCYVFCKAIRRHRAVAATLAAIMVLISVSAVGLGVLYRSAERQRQVAEEHAEALRRRSYFNSIALAQNAYEAADAAQLDELLAACPADLRGWEWHYLRGLANQSKLTIPAHSGYISAVAFAPDETLVLSAGREDRVLKLWDARSDALVRTLSGHQTEVACAAFSPDGRFVASGGYDEDGRIRLWDVATGKQVLELAGHAWTVLEVAFTCDGRRLVSLGSVRPGTDDHLLKIWDARTGSLLAQASARERDFSSLALSPDGELIATGEYYGAIALWDAQHATLRASFTAHDRIVGGLAFDSSGQRLYSGSWDKSVKVWSVREGTLLMTFPATGSEVYDLVLMPDETRIVTGQRGMLQVWDAATGRCLQRLLSHRGDVSTLACAPGGKWLLSGSTDGTLRTWDANERDTVAAIAPGVGRIGALACSPNGQWLAVGGDPGCVKLFDACTFECLRTLEGHEQRILRLDFRYDSQRLISGSGDGTVRLWELPGGRELHCLRHASTYVPAVGWAPDGRTVATGAMDGTVVLWDAVTGERLQGFRADPQAVYTLDFSPDGRFLASAGSESTIKIWRASNGAPLRALHGHTAAVECVRYSPDGKWLASVGLDCTAILWDPATGQCLQSMKGHGQRVRDVAFSPDGRRLVTVSWDTTMKIWDTATGQLAITLPGHEYAPNAVTMTPDGRRVLSGGQDQLVKVWDPGSRSAATQQPEGR